MFSLRSTFNIIISITLFGAITALLLVLHVGPASYFLRIQFVFIMLDLYAAILLPKPNSNVVHVFCLLMLPIFLSSGFLCFVETFILAFSLIRDVLSIILFVGLVP